MVNTSEILLPQLIDEREHDCTRHTRQDMEAMFELLLTNPRGFKDDYCCCTSQQGKSLGRYEIQKSYPTTYMVRKKGVGGQSHDSSVGCE